MQLVEKIRQLVEILEKSNIEEIEVGFWRRIRVSKGYGIEPLSRSEPPVKIDKTQSASTRTAPKEEFVSIKSPEVGTFHRASEPGKEPLVNVNSSVEEGQIICFIEVVHLMREVRSPKNGRIEEIMVEEGESVEYAQKLFRVRLE